MASTFAVLLETKYWRKPNDNEAINKFQWSWCVIRALLSTAHQRDTATSFQIEACQTNDEMKRTISLRILSTFSREIVKVLIFIAFIIGNQRKPRLVGVQISWQLILVLKFVTYIYTDSRSKKLRRKMFKRLRDEDLDHLFENCGPTLKALSDDPQGMTVLLREKGLLGRQM